MGRGCIQKAVCRRLSWGKRVLESSLYTKGCLQRALLGERRSKSPVPTTWPAQLGLSPASDWLRLGLLPDMSPGGPSPSALPRNLGLEPPPPTWDTSLYLCASVSPCAKWWALNTCPRLVDRLGGAREGSVHARWPWFCSRVKLLFGLLHSSAPWPQSLGL